MLPPAQKPDLNIQYVLLAFKYLGLGQWHSFVDLEIQDVLDVSGARVCQAGAGEGRLFSRST